MPVRPSNAPPWMRNESAWLPPSPIVVEDLASGTAQGTLPWSWYSDPELLRREQERIFRHGWQYAGPAEHAAEPGDFFTCSVGDIPVVVTRDRDGELHALLNVCRHRGSLVAQGRGNRATLQCPYHAWTYELDGRLRSAPRGPELELDGICLRELAVEAWGPLLFVHPEADPPPLADTLGPLPELLASGGIELDLLRVRRRSEFELACNWKIAVENYLECYHCAVAHPGFSQVVDVSPDAYKLETHALGSSQFGPSRNGGGPVEGQFHWLWPATRSTRCPAPRTSRPGRRAARRRADKRASSTTSSPRRSRTRRSRSCSPSTTRSGARTARSSSRSRQASAPGCSTRAVSCPRARSCWPISSRSCERHSPESRPADRSRSLCSPPAAAEASPRPRASSAPGARP